MRCGRSSRACGPSEPGETKNGEGRLIPLTGELYEIQTIQKEPAISIGQNAHGCSSASGSPLRTQRAGLWSGDEETGKPTRIFHDLRRTGVRNLVRAGVPERVTMTISGHKTRNVFDRYNVVSETDLKDAARRLGEYLAERTPKIEETQAPKDQAADAGSVH